MPIYNIFEQVDAVEEQTMEKKKLSFSSLAARFFFLLLLCCDIIWGVYAVLLFAVTTLLSVLTGFKIRRMQSKAYLRVKRSLICALALFVAIFSPALGIMF